MRKLTLICALLLSCAFAGFAQNNRAFKKGYQGDVEISNYAVFGKDKYGGMVLVTTTHGYRMGNGMFLGAGLGAGYDLASGDGPVIPLFLDAKYNFLDTAVSPFASVRTGTRFCGSPRLEMFQPFIAVAAGVDAGRFSVKLGYDYGNIRQYVYGAYTTHDILLSKPSQWFCSFAIKF